MVVKHGQVKSGIEAYLDQPDSEVLIDHEVKAKQLKLVLPVDLHELLLVTKDRIDHQVPYPGYEVLPEV